MFSANARNGAGVSNPVWVEISGAHHDFTPFKLVVSRNASV
jgi:hypothetical protein